MSFRFPLQKIVDLKTNEKTQAEWILSQTIGILRDEEHSLTSLHSEKSELHNHLHEAVISNVNISELRSFQNYMNHLDSRISLKKMDVQKAEKIVVQKQEHLLTKVIDEKVWTNVKQKAKLVFDISERILEQKVLDEVATNRHRTSF